MDTSPAKADLIFVHLSDIHFRKGRAGDVHDEDEMLRNGAISTFPTYGRRPMGAIIIGYRDNTEHGFCILKSFRALAKAVEEAEYQRAKRKLELRDFWW